MFKLSKYHLAILALIGTNVIWGASVPIFKWSLQDMPPFTFAFIRFLLASLILLPFTMHRLKITRHDVISLFVLAFVGFFVHIGLLLVGLKISSSLNASIIAASAPILLIVGSIIFLKEKVRTSIILGTVVSLIGVIVIILRPIFDVGLDGTISGNILFLIATLAFVVYTFLLKNYTTHLRTTTVTFYMFAFSTIMFLPLFLMESTNHNILEFATFQAIFGVLFGAILTSVAGYLFYNYAIRYVKPSETGIFLYMDPVVTIIVAVPLLGEKLTSVFLVGSLLVFIGIFIAERRIHYHPVHRLRKKYQY